MAYVRYYRFFWTCNDYGRGAQSPFRQKSIKNEVFDEGYSPVTFFWRPLAVTPHLSPPICHPHLSTLIYHPHLSPSPVFGRPSVFTLHLPPRIRHPQQSPSPVTNTCRPHMSPLTSHTHLPLPLFTAQLTWRGSQIHLADQCGSRKANFRHVFRPFSWLIAEITTTIYVQDLCWWCGAGRQLQHCI